MKKGKRKINKASLKKILIPKKHRSVNRPVFFRRIGNRHS